MPLFEYKCKDCGCVFEYLQFNKNEKVKCKKCGSAKLEKLISSFAFSGHSDGECGHSHSPACSCCPSQGCPKHE